MVWVIRILIISSLTASLEGSSQAQKPVHSAAVSSQPPRFPVNSRPATGFGRPQTSTPSAQAANPRAAVTSMVRPNNARFSQPIQDNEFMALEEQGSHNR